MQFESYLPPVGMILRQSGKGTTLSMLLYHYPGSPNAIKVKTVLHHLNLPFEEKIIDLPGGESFSPEFKQINPNCTIPVLVDGDLTLNQSNAIMVYLAEKAKSSLWPSDPKMRAQALQWLDWSNCEWGPGVATVEFQRLAPHFIQGFVTDEKVVEGALAKVARFAPVLDEHLARNQFILGNEVTLPDIAIAALMFYWEAAQVPLQQYSNILKWYGRIQELASWKKALPAMAASA